MTSEVVLDVFKGPRDYVGAKRDIMAAGYKGERTVLLAPTDFPLLKTLANVCAEVMTKVGLDVDYQALDWRTIVQRCAKKEPLDQGGWSVFNTFWAASDQLSL